MKSKSLLLALIVVASVTSCTNGGPHLSGEWRSKNNTTLIITQEHKTYFVKSPAGDFMGTFEEGKLKLSATSGDIQYSEERDKLYFSGEEFSRKEFLEAEAVRIQANKTSFHGTWKKVPKEGGQMLSDILMIDLLEDGRFSISESRPFFNAEFRDVKYEQGVIAGVYHFEVDNEHNFPFEVRKVDGNTIIYKDERGSEPFKRFVEKDAFTGRWKGYYLSYGGEIDKGTGQYHEIEEKTPTFTFTVAKEASRYKIVMSSTTSSAPSNLSGRFQNGKITVAGNAKDFYKYQVPTLEASANDTLMYRDGGGDVRLKRTQ
jgi:hypothetical protein